MSSENKENGGGNFNDQILSVDWTLYSLRFPTALKIEKAVIYEFEDSSRPFAPNIN